MPSFPRPGFALIVAVLVVLDGAAAGAGGTPAQQCQAGKNKVAGAYAACRQNAEAKLAASGDAARYTAALGKCAARFEAKWQSLTARAADSDPPCSDASVPEGAFEGVIDAHTDNVATALNGGALQVCCSGGSAAGPLSVKDFGAQGDGVHDDTLAVQRAIASQAGTGGEVYFPAGTYLLQSTAFQALPSNMVIRGAGQGRGSAATTLKSASGGHVIEITGAYVTRIEIANLRIVGAGATGNDGHGIYFHDNGPYGGPSHLWIHDVTIERCGGHGIYMPEEWHTTIENVSIDDCGDHLFDLQGGNTTTLLRCYAHQVAQGKAGYRIRGPVVMISCNGVDNPSGHNAIDWGVFGQSVADGDPVDSYSNSTLINCNIEDFTNRGVYVKEGSHLQIQGGAFTAPLAGSVRPLVVYFAGGDATVLSGNVSFLTKGATYLHGAPVEVGEAMAGRSPVIQIGTMSQEGTPLRFWAAGIAGTADVPTISTGYAGYVNGVPTTAVRLNAGWIDDLVYLKFKGRQWDVDTGPPVSGEHSRGEVVFNAAPEAGGPSGWMCVSSGTPGVWKAMANLAP